MSNAAAMLRTYPAETNLDTGLLAKVIDEALTCFQTCTACADACLAGHRCGPDSAVGRDQLVVVDQRRQHRLRGGVEEHQAS